MTNKPTISHSDIKAFKRCRRKWNWRSKLREGWRQKDIQPQFFLGSGVHYALEKWYMGEAGLIEAFDEWCKQERKELEETFEYIPDYKKDELNEQEDLGRGMLEHYKSWAEEYDPKYFKEVKETELEGKVLVQDPDGKDEPGHFHFIIDGLAVDENGLLWLMEHKTAKQIRTGHLDLDEQILKYMWAAQKKYDVQVAGVIYTIMRKKLPKSPKELKSGGLSKSKSQSTTYAVYRESLIDYYGEGEVPWDDYKDVLQHYKDGGNKFFWRKKITRAQAEVEEAGERLYKEYRDMLDDPRIYPNPTKQCQWDCEFHTACKLKSIGADFRAELEKNFERKGDE